MRENTPSQPSLQQSDSQQREGQVEHTSHTSQRLRGKRQHRPSHRQSVLRAGFAVVAGRTMGALSRRLHLGGGTSIAGIIAQRVYPDIVEHLAAQLEHGSVLITGTNGKTTTSSFIAAILRNSGLRVWHNKEGSNLMRGVASSLVIRALPNGHLRRSGHAISIFEVDEAALPQVVQAVPPRVVVFTNLFRDQLDRYGEVDSVLTTWKRAISYLPPTTTLVLNADDPSIASLADAFAGKILYYGIEDTAPDHLIQQTDTERHQVIDARACPHCGHEYVYDIRFYSHMGHYACPNCERKRPQPDVQATHIQRDSFDQLRIQVTKEAQHREIVIPLPGLYNIYNALAAITAALVLGIEWDPIASGIERSKPVFGRGERIQAEGRTLCLLLAKNPTGFNEVLRTLFSERIPRHVLFVLNDNIADGQDISWIWDVDFEQVVGHTSTLVVAGTRTRDLALRLKYAGVTEEEMLIIPPTPLRANRNEKAHEQVQRAAIHTHEQELIETHAEERSAQVPRVYTLKKALKKALEQTPVGETLFVVPTYTALLEVHRELESQGLTAHYWEGKDA